ncbi:MAG: glycoside hydrolase family 3 C-terminal domain-containing protein [Oscillospiraceae bacterium]|nr:glycoside hydrolase family 3 C-terminal domain-containing protein [Oscillospiraceae bacterium]
MEQKRITSGCLKYQDLIAQMTLEEKASLMSGANFWHTKAVERLGIPGMMLTDGPHGLRKQGGQADHLGLNQSVPATCYPTAAGLANTWDEALLEEMGKSLGLEAASEGVSVLLGPGVNIKRSPLCGRNFEYFSEDPYLAGKMAAALIRGIQSNGISACVKHYAANSQELRRMSNDSVVDERTLREIYLPAFEMAVKEGGVKCLMTSYNRVNGTYAHENEHLLREILYGEWGYEGVVVSDWGGNNDRVASVKAGGTLEMPSSNGQTDRHIVEAVRSGVLEERLLDEQVDRLLELEFVTRPHVIGKSYDREAHHAVATAVAEKTVVLLKNEDGILPLQKEKTIAVIGGFAKTPRYQGAGSSRVNPTKLENGLDALKAIGAKVTGYAPGFRRGGKMDPMLIRQACNLAKKADVVLLWLGLDEGGEAEGIDRESMKLPENQLALLDALAQVNDRIVVVLSCGCSVEMQWDNQVKALVHGYLGGQAGALAMARLLTGAVNFSGKLSETIPMCYAEMPSAPWYPGLEATSEYREGLYVGYRYFDTALRAVKYPFGHGLSYTPFEYSALEICEDRVRFRIRNTGAVSGEEVAQLYIHAGTGGMFRPAQELKGFARVALEPGEEKEVTITMDSRSFAVWSIAENGWVVEPGAYELRIGASSRDIRLTGTVTKEGTTSVNPYEGAIFSPYYSGEVQNIPDDVFAALLGREIPNGKWDRSGPIGFNDTISQGFYLSGGVGKYIYNLLSAAHQVLMALGHKEKANDLMFIMNLPWRGIARMSGVLTDEQVCALLEMVNRRKGGFRRFAASLLKK